jgi:hypothetical protein
MQIDAYGENLVYGLVFHNSRMKNIKFLGRGGWADVFLITFSNGMELVIKTCKLYYKNYHEIQNIKILTQPEQSPYVCYYYGYTTIQNNKYVFVSTNNNLKFDGTLKEIPRKILKNKIIPEETFSYFNIIMEKLEMLDTSTKILNYKTVNTIYMVTFLIGCLKGLRDISKKRVVHGDIHKIENLGFYKKEIDGNQYYIPKLLDFGSIKISDGAFIDKSDKFWKLKTFKKEGYYKWGPEMIGCINDNYSVNKTKYENDQCDIKKSIAVQNSDIFMFFKGIVLNEIFEMHNISATYSNKNDDVYNNLYKIIHANLETNTKIDEKIFNDNVSRKKFVTEMTKLILDCLDPDYITRPIANDVIMELYKCFQLYMISNKVDRIYQTVQKTYNEFKIA